MENLKITGGSEKQNEWATKIANDWMAQYDKAIANQKIREESDGMAPYIAILENNRDKLVALLSKAKAKPLIDMFLAKHDVSAAMVTKSLKEFKGK